MLNKKTLCDLRSETGLDYNDKDQIESALKAANFSLRLLDDDEMERKNDSLHCFIKEIKNLKELISTSIAKAKYKNDIIALKVRLKELSLKDFLSNLTKQDVIFFIDVFRDVCKMEAEVQVEAKKIALNKDEIASHDIRNYYIEDNNDNIMISKASYALARTKGALTYVACSVASKASNEVSKVLKKSI